MISQPAKPDAIDQLLSRIAREAELENEQRLATFIQRVIARLVDTAIVIGVAYGVQILFVNYVKAHNTINVDYIVKSVEQALKTPASEPIKADSKPATTMPRRPAGRRFFTIRGNAP